MVKFSRLTRNRIQKTFVLKKVLIVVFFAHLHEIPIVFIQTFTQRRENREPKNEEEKMRRFNLLIIGSIFLLTSAFVASAQSAASISAINSKVAAINKGQKKYKRVKKDVTDISTEGAEATFYHDRRILKKIAAKIYGETYNATANLYYDRGDPLYYEFRENRYDTQIGLDKPVKVVKVTNEKYYFTGRKLVRITVGNKILKKSDPKYAEMRDRMTELTKGLKAAY